MSIKKPQTSPAAASGLTLCSELGSDAKERRARSHSASSRAMDQGDGYTRVAVLCISNFKYLHEGGIANAEKDAKAFEEKLKELQGCTVKLCENFEQPQDFTDKIRDFLQDEGA